MDKSHGTSLPSVSIRYDLFEGRDTYERFIVGDQEFNRTVYERIRYLLHSEIYKEKHFVCYTEDDKLVGALGIEKSPYEEDLVWFKFVSVDPDFRAMGIGSTLVQMCIEYVEANGQRIEMSSYSELGEIFLKPKISKLQESRPHLFHAPKSLGM